MLLLVVGVTTTAFVVIALRRGLISPKVFGLAVLNALELVGLSIGFFAE